MCLIISNETKINLHKDVYENMIKTIQFSDSQQPIPCCIAEVKVRVLLPVKHPGSFWPRLSALSAWGSKTHTKVTVFDDILKLLIH